MRMPVLFLSHGSPMQAIQETTANRVWRTLGENLPKPKAIIAISAHWESEWPMVMSHPAPSIVHDFSGFPPALYKLNYPAPGLPVLAQSVKHCLAQADISCQLNGCRGLDHGAWVPLRYMYPEATIPVIQLSVQTGLNAQHHWRVGRAIEKLRGDDVLILASGHMTHNLMDWRQRSLNEPLDYALDFQNWVRRQLDEKNIDTLLDWVNQAPSAHRAHPTPEHFLPFFVALGAAGESDTKRIVEGWEGPSLSLDSYQFG